MLIKEKSFLFLIVIVIFILSTVAAAAQTTTTTPPLIEDDNPETVFTEEIKLNVSAFDEAGNFVSMVGDDDIVIVEDNRLHQPSSIRRIPANVLIVLDTGGEMRNVKSIKQTRQTASVLVNSLSDEDTVAVIEYNDEAKILSEWTSNREITLRAINQDLNFGKRDVFVDALKLATNFLRKAENENRHLVLISDGTDSFDRTEERMREMRRLMGTNINVHVLSYAGLEAEKVAPKTRNVGVPTRPNALPPEVIAGLPNGVRETANATTIMSINTDRKFLRVMRKRQQDLEEGGKFLLELSENTSGMFIAPESPDEMILKAALVARIIDSNYVVTYTPKRPLSESPDGEIRTVEVSSRKEGLRVSARRKIIVEKEGN